MRFALSDDQAAFRDAVRDLLAKECTPAVVRAAWDAPAGRLDRGVWDSLDAMGDMSSESAKEAQKAIKYRAYETLQ
jgi:alkylation response protein AidB-like acyl-CoA dehydrogenase